MEGSKLNQSKFDNFIKENKKLSLSVTLKKKINNFIAFHFQSVSFAFIDGLNHALFHFFDTLKVRYQAMSNKDDVSGFRKNQVKLKSNFVGITPSVIGAFMSGFIFMYSNAIILKNLFNRRKKGFIYELNWRIKFMISYAISDFLKMTCYMIFEARKQRIQLCQSKSEMELSKTWKFILRAYPILITRELLFRFVNFGFFLQFMQPIHKPQLIFPLDEIVHIIKDYEKEGVHIDKRAFMDYSKIDISETEVYFKSVLLFSAVMATVITMPFDVIATKILTQTETKYKGFFQSLRLLLKEEGAFYLIKTGFYPRFIYYFSSIMVSNFGFMAMNNSKKNFKMFV